MRCWNCNKRLPKKAKICQFCEAPVQAGPTKEEEETVRDLFDQLPPEAMDEFRKAFESSATAEEFANLIMVGECPKCGSTDTGDCDSDPEIGEILVGRCYECGQLWCTECGRLLTVDKPSCPCWEEEEPDF